MAQYFVNPDKAVWAATTAFALNSYVCPTTGYATAAAKRFVYEATSIGSSPNQTGATEPTWPTTVDGTVVDGDITWTARYPSTWEKATKYSQHLADYSAGTVFANGDEIILAADKAAPVASGKKLTFFGPTLYGECAFCYSATVSTGTTTTYEAEETVNQIDTGTGDYDIVFDGSWLIEGVRGQAGDDVAHDSSSAECVISKNCYWKLGAAGGLWLGLSGSNGFAAMLGGVVDVSSDTADTTNVLVIMNGGNTCVFNGVTITRGATADYRTGAYLVDCGSGFQRVENCDFSQFSRTTGLMRPRHGSIISNCKTSSAHDNKELLDHGSTAVQSMQGIGTHCGTAYSPTAMTFGPRYSHFCYTQTSIKRTGGAEIGGTGVALAIVSANTTTRGTFGFSPWQYETLSSTGTKNFRVYFAQEASQTALTNAQFWLEVETLDTANDPRLTLHSSQPAIKVTATDNPTDTESTWTGFTGTPVKQYVEVTGVPVAIAGMFRWRVCWSKAGLDQSGEKLNVDMKVYVS